MDQNGDSIFKNNSSNKFKIGSIPHHPVAYGEIDPLNKLISRNSQGSQL